MLTSPDNDNAVLVRRPASPRPFTGVAVSVPPTLTGGCLGHMLTAANGAQQAGSGP